MTLPVRKSPEPLKVTYENVNGQLNSTDDENSTEGAVPNENPAISNCKEW